MNRSASVVGAAGLAAGVTGLLVARTARRRHRELDRRLGDLVIDRALQEIAVTVPAGEDLRGEAPTICVVVPAYDEADGIVGVLAELPTQLVGYVIRPVVVVDGGTDGTEQAARDAGFITVAHEVNRGQGDALRTGFRCALRLGATIVMTMDADGQHRPDEMIELVRPIVAGEADYVQGSRFLGASDDAGGARDVGIRGFTALINVVSGAGITDCTNGFRAIRASELARLRLEEPRFSAPELIIESSRRGLRIREVPVHIRSRTHGESKKPAKLRYPAGFLGVIVRTWRR